MFRTHVLVFWNQTHDDLDSKLCERQSWELLWRPTLLHYLGEGGYTFVGKSWLSRLWSFGMPMNLAGRFLQSRLLWWGFRRLRFVGLVPYRGLLRFPFTGTLNYSITPLRSRFLPLVFWKRFKIHPVALGRLPSWHTLHPPHPSHPSPSSHPAHPPMV